MSNHLSGQTSPYLLQHADNPVDWYPWGEEVFRRAREEDRPIFLSIGYSTCHWCHVMAHESFEDPEVADYLNSRFLCVKVDREERPDLDSVYMAACQAFTGSGGWPATLFLTPDGKPFYAGTYFPKHSRRGSIGLMELLEAVWEAWERDRPALLQQADTLLRRLTAPEEASGTADETLLDDAVTLLRRSYDRKNGGFGPPPKFPIPHTLLFLLACHKRRGDPGCLEMAEHTLTQMYRGGLCDHIGGGFCRYSTDAQFLVPHFEKMLYDNALMILACCRAWTVTGKPLYRHMAERTADYVLRELTAPGGGFCSAQDADSGGEEGKYYLFTPYEVKELFGPAEGEAFCRRYDIRSGGNFQGRSIPSLLHSDPEDHSLDRLLPRLREYRAGRCSLHLDDKVLTAWNGWMIAALCALYRAGGDTAYLSAARQADSFLWEHLYRDGTLFVSFREGRPGARGFLDDYAALLFAQLSLYEATLERGFLVRADELRGQIDRRFSDGEKGGYYLYGSEHERLILRPKETYDGAIPSGNGLMAYCLTRLWLLTGAEADRSAAARQLDFLSPDAARYPPGHAMFLLALLDFHTPPPCVTVVPAPEADRAALARSLPEDWVVRLWEGDPDAYPLKDGRTTFYVCRDGGCLPPVNESGPEHP